MRRLVPILLAFVALAMLPAVPGQAAAMKRDCGTVSLHFSGQELTKARKISARGTTCRTARKVALDAQNHPFGKSYRSQGFGCAGTQDHNAPGLRYDWRCGRKGASIRFAITDQAGG